MLADDDIGQDDPPVPSIADDAEDAIEEDTAAMRTDGPRDESTAVDLDPVLADDDLAQDELAVPVWDADEDVRVPPVADDAGDGAEGVDVDDPWEDDLAVPVWDADEDVRAPAVADDVEDAAGDGAEGVVVDDTWEDDLAVPVWDADEDVRAPAVADDAGDAAGDGGEGVVVDDTWEDDLGVPVWDADEDVRAPAVADDAGDAAGDGAEGVVVDDTWEDDLAVPVWDADEDVRAPAVADDAGDAAGDGGEGVVVDDTWEDDLAVPVWDADEDVRAPAAADDAEDATGDGAEGVVVDDTWEDDLGVPSWDADEDVRAPAVGDGVLEDMIGEARGEDDVPAWLLDDVPEDATAQGVEVESVLVERADSHSGDPTVADDDESASTVGVAVASGGALPTGFVVEADEGRFVQVGAYVVAVRADAVATRLRERTELPVRIQPADRDGRLFYLVRIGPVPPGGMPDDLADELGIGRDAFASLTAQALRIVSGGDTYLQVGVYADRDSAERVADQAGAETGYPVEVRRMERRGRTPLYRVRVGPVDD